MIRYNHQIPMFEDEPIVVRTVSKGTRIISFTHDNYVFIDVEGIYNLSDLICPVEEIVEWEYLKPEVMQMHFFERIDFADAVIEQTKPSRIRMSWYKFLSSLYRL